MLAFTCLPNSYENNAKITILFRLSSSTSSLFTFLHQYSPSSNHYKLQHSLEILGKGSRIFHDSAPRKPEADRIIYSNVTEMT